MIQYGKVIVTGLFLFFCLWSGISQNEKTLSFNNNNLKDITFQTYKGLPRVGCQYKVPTDPKYKRNNENAMKSFWKMIELYHLQEDLAKIDLKQLKYDYIKTKRDQPYLQKIFSFFMLEIHDLMATENAKLKYEITYEASARDMEKTESHFQRFIADNLKSLTDNSNKIWEGDIKEFYAVKSHGIAYGGRKDNFDRTNGGFWIDVKPNDKIYKNKYHSYATVKHIPKADFERDLGPALFEMSTEKAESLLKRTSVLYVVQKFKLHLKNKDLSPETHNSSSNSTFKYRDILQFEFQLSDKIIEIYEDEQLSKLVGTIDLENALFKE